MKKKKETKIFVLTLMIFATIIPVAAAMNENTTGIEKTQTQETGNTLYVGGYGPGNYSSIQEAINDAVAGDTIFVFDESSPYYETLTISKSINLIGENKETTIIDAEGQNNVIYIDNDNIKITGFTIRNSSWTGVQLYRNPDYINISNNNIINNYYGILFNPGIHSNLKNEPIRTTGLSNCIISNNKISNNDLGVYLNYANDNIIFNNNISNNYKGICLSISQANKIYLNNFMKNRKNAEGGDLFAPSYSNLWYDPISKKGNYWDNYKGFDKLPPYGIGDTPYIIPPWWLGDKDKYPLMKPYNGSWTNNQNTQNNQQSQINNQQNPTLMKQTTTKPLIFFSFFFLYG